MKRLLVIAAVGILLLAGCEKESEVVTMDNGLKYQDDTLGTGKAAELGNLVKLHFKGWFIKDSTNLFTDWSNDSSRATQKIGNSFDINQPIKFILEEGAFIKGITPAITGMKEGGTRTIIIPSELAYGKQGIGPIPPNSDLKVVVNLLEVKEPVVAEMWDVDTTKAITTESGLKYIVVKEGEGAAPDSGDIVTVDYTGWLQDSTKFDSSVEKDEPFKFVFKAQPLIQGWEEGLGLMKEGAKYRLIIPPSLGYKDVKMGQIPPNSTLIFDIELLKVEKNE